MCFALTELFVHTSVDIFTSNPCSHAFFKASLQGEALGNEKMKRFDSILMIAHDSQHYKNRHFVVLVMTIQLNVI